MTDLHDLLRTASDPSTSTSTAPHDASREILLGRRALRRRRLTTGLAATASVGAVVGILAGALALGGRGADGSADLSVAGSTSATASPSASASATPTALETVNPTPTNSLTTTAATSGQYTFGKTPQGWEAGEGNDYAGHLVPTAGGVNADPASFRGKITAYLDDHVGEHKTVFHVEDGWIAERPITVAGKKMAITVQVPLTAGLSDEDVDRLVAAVTVDPTAKPGLG